MLHTINEIPNNKQLTKGSWGLSTWETFGVLCAVSLVVFFVQDQLILTKDVYYSLLGEQMALDRIDALLNFQAKWKWVNYVVIPFMLLLQSAIIAACMFTGAILLDWKLPYRAFFGLVIRAMAVVTMGKILQTIILLFMDIQSMDDFYQADWFSLLGWVGKANLPELAMVPASFLNVFEVLFWILLAAGVRQLSEKAKGLGFVAGTYGVGLVLWCLFLVYLQVNFGS
jgi:hypothetical protein